MLWRAPSTSWPPALPSSPSAISAKPADSNHPYGHHKAEYFSAVFEGVLVVLAALSIFHSAYLGFSAPKPLDAPFEGLAIDAAASLLNGIWAWLLLLWGRRWRSPALVADGRHVLTDVFTSGGVLVGVALVAVTDGWCLTRPWRHSHLTFCGRAFPWCARRQAA